MAREQDEARALATDPRIRLLAHYLFDIDDPNDPEFERARHRETKAAVVLRRLAALSGGH